MIRDILAGLFLGACMLFAWFAPIVVRGWLGQ